MIPRMFTSLGAGLFALLALGTNPRAPFRSDPPMVCDRCGQWNAPLEPFRIFGNTYYVGPEQLSSLLITSDGGHILLDGALPQSAEMIDAHIRRLGFRTEDVKLIVSSHAHFDHAGGIHALQRPSGAVVASSPSGARALKRGLPGSDDPQYGFGRSSMEFPRVRKVRVVKDGETLAVGTLGITAHFTPGHTPGATTWTWKSCEGSRCLAIVYADSLTASVAPGFTYSADPARVAAFRKAIATVAALPCDIVVAVHPEFTDLLGKLARRASGQADAFVDATACREYAAFGTRSLDRQLAQEARAQ